MIIIKKAIDKLEDVLLWVVSKVPQEKLPNQINRYIDKCLNKRVFQLQQDIIKKRWELAKKEQSYNLARMQDKNNTYI